MNIIIIDRGNTSDKAENTKILMHFPLFFDTFDTYSQPTDLVNWVSEFLFKA